MIGVNLFLKGFIVGFLFFCVYLLIKLNLEEFSFLRGKEFLVKRVFMILLLVSI